MANFFKDYQAEVKRKREQERAEELKRINKERARRDYLDGLERGDKVKYSVLVYAGTETPANVQTLYYAGRVSADSVLLSDDRQQARNGYGYLCDECGILC